MEVNKAKRIAVTGATGFLGSHITERLLAEGHHVGILARSRDRAQRFENRVDKIVIANISDSAALEQLFEGVDTVFHLVSNFRTASSQPESYRKINVEGTKAAITAAKGAGVKRFIYCSTIGVHGHVKSTPANEDSPYNPGDLYQESKMEAECFCRGEADKGDMEIVIVRPCSIYGPGDLRMLKMFKMLAKRTFMLVGPCKENFHAVYIDDLVDGFLRVLETPGIAGETFIIGGAGYLSLKDYIAQAAKALGAPMPWLRFPYWFFYFAAVVIEAVCVPFGIEPPLHRRRVSFYKNNRAFSIDKARKMLGYSPVVALEEGMRRTVTWYRENGYLS